MKDAEKFIVKIEEKAKEWDISAVMALEDREGFRYENAFGYADRAAKRPLTQSDRFCLDSESCIFLVLCAMRLMEEGKLRLSDKVSRFIPEYRLGDKITVRNILKWDTGLPDYWCSVRMTKLQKDPAHAALSDQERFVREYALHAADIPFAEVLKDINGLELTHEPGREDDGSETGMKFLAEIIRRASGMTAPEYLFRHFFAPLGMADTRPGNDATAALSGVFRDDVLIPLPALSPETAFTTTLADMNRLARALAEKQFFSEKTWALMLKCNWHDNAFGFSKQGSLFIADTYPTKLRNNWRLYLDFDSGLSMLILNSEEMRMKLDQSRRWRSFNGDFRRAWLDTRVYPDKPEMQKVSEKNVWDAMDIEILPEQLDFVPECTRCMATMLAQKQPVYVLMDHGVAVGMAGLTVKPRKNDFAVSYLQVDYRYQHRGYGRILLTKAIDILKKAGAKELEIGVNRFNLPAQRLYRSVGFQDKEIYDEFIALKMTL